MGTDALNDAPLPDLLAVADSKWVLGHWYIKVMHNGRSVADFASLAGIIQEELGQTRSLFRYIENKANLEPGCLEHGRDVRDIRSMQVLDRPPLGWGDFIMTMAIVEAATLSVGEAISQQLSPTDELNGLLRKIFQEEYFHELLSRGWLKTLSGADLDGALAALNADSGRLVAAFAWFGPALDGGNGSGLVWSASRSAFAAKMKSLISEIAPDRAGAVAAAEDSARKMKANWDATRHRPQNSVIPATLWEFMVPTSKAALLARRPRDIAFDDDFSTAGKDFDEYVEEGTL